MAEDFPRHPTGEWFNHQEYGTSVRVAISATAAGVTSALTAGNLYVIAADHAWVYAQGNFTSGAVSQIAASVTTGFPLAAYEKKYIWVWSATAGGIGDIGNDAVSGVSMTGGSGFFWYAKVKP